LQAWDTGAGDPDGIAIEVGGGDRHGN